MADANAERSGMLLVRMLFLPMKDDKVVCVGLSVSLNCVAAHDNAHPLFLRRKEN